MKTTNLYIKQILLMVVSLLIANISFAQNATLEASLKTYLNSKKANIGISATIIETYEQLSINGDKQYPMQSVYKFPLALAVLDAVDKKKISLAKKIRVTKKDLKPNTWSPLREKYPEGNIDISIADLLDYSVAKSDNNACDILFKIIGGTSVVQKYIKKIGINDIAIVSTESEMAQDWKLQYLNYAHPDAMTQLLIGFYTQRYLSVTSNNFLMQLMINTSNSANRIKALLPENTIVAHKTGTSATDKSGLRPALNDVGIITLPNGYHIALSIFVSNATELYEDGEKTIAEITKLIWDYYSKQ